jgi:hypothetical protein
LTDDLPITTTHRGIGIYAGQPAKRVALVKAEIDRVSRIADLIELSRIAGDASWAPESRLLASAKCVAGLQRATERRESKPGIDPDAVVASTAGLDSVKWADPYRYCSLCDAHHERAVRRERPLLRTRTTALPGNRHDPSARKARWRNRQRRGVTVVPVDISASTLDFLIATHWLRDDAVESVAIGDAMGRCSKTPRGANNLSTRGQRCAAGCGRICPPFQHRFANESFFRSPNDDRPCAV